MTKYLKDLPVPKSVKISDFFMFHMGKIQRKQNVSNIWPLFGHFWENSATDLYGPAYKFTRPLLSYAAEESASWEPCLQLLVSEVLAQLLRYTLHKHTVIKTKSISQKDLWTRVADPYPDPDWIRIQSGQWIRIQEGKNDPQK
jgi:hypothetical protein